MAVGFERISKDQSRMAVGFAEVSKFARDNRVQAQII
jgi:hypothetical protein